MIAVIVAALGRATSGSVANRTYWKTNGKRRITNMSGEWIPCGERQPDYEVPVIAWADGYALVAMLRCDEHGDFWDSFQEGDEIDPACITHWMPITPPTGSK